MEQTPFEVVMEHAIQEESSPKLSMKEIEDKISSIVSKAFHMPQDLLQNYCMKITQSQKFRTEGHDVLYTMRDILKMNSDTLREIGVTRELVEIWMLRCACAIAGVGFGSVMSALFPRQIRQKYDDTLYELYEKKGLQEISPLEATPGELRALRDRLS